MAGYCIVPTPLALAYQALHGFHLGIGGTVVEGKFCLDMGCCKRLLYPHPYLVALALTLIHGLAQCVGTLPVASLARAVDVGERAHDVVVGVLDSAFTYVGHVAVGTAHAALAVYTHCEKFISWMLCFQNRSL